MSNTESAKTLPTYRIYSVVAKDEKPVWQEIGAAWKHKDGKGLALQFKALPLPNAEVVLRVPSTKAKTA